MRREKRSETKTESEQKRKAGNIFSPICMRMLFQPLREKEMELSRGFVINTHRRQFWQAQIPYLSRRTLGKGLLS